MCIILFYPCSARMCIIIINAAHEHLRNKRMHAGIYTLFSIVGSKIVHYTTRKAKAAMERALSYLFIALACLMTRPNQAMGVRGKSTVSVVNVCA